jgi:hypothetical protein
MKKIDNSRIILRYSDDSNVIHDVGLDSILDGGFPIDPESGNEMDYLGTLILPE